MLMRSLPGAGQRRGGRQVAWLRSVCEGADSGRRRSMRSIRAAWTGANRICEAAVRVSEGDSSELQWDAWHTDVQSTLV